MLSPKPWKPETFTALIGALFLCFGLGSLAAHFLLQSERITALGSEEFVTVLVGVIALQVPVFLVIAWFVRVNGTTWREAFGFSAKGWKRLVVMSGAVTVLGIGITLGLTFVSDFVLRSTGVHEPAVQSTVKALQSTVSASQKILFGVVAIVIAPVVEELLFRGTIYSIIKQFGSAKFVVGDLTNISAFINRLKEPQDDVSAFLRGRISAELNEELSKHDESSLLDKSIEVSLIEFLNQTIESDLIYDSERFDQTSLRPKTKRLLEGISESEPKLLLNRLLLEDSFPSELSRKRRLSYNHVAIWATSVLFGLVHFNTLTFVALVVFSALLILLYEETDNLLAPIISHSLFNAINFVWLLYTMRSANEGI